MDSRYIGGIRILTTLPFWWLARVTLVGCSWLFALLYECRLSGRDTLGRSNPICGNYRPQTKVMFLHVSVCPKGGGYPSMPCLQAHIQGEVEGSGQGGLQAHTQGGS